MATFTWLPSHPFDQDESPRVRVTKFGDGYEARQDEDLNTNPFVFPLVFANRDITESTAIIAFLRARGAKESFDWTPPGEAAGKYVCRSWKRSRTAPGNISISATFEQVFEP